MGRTGRKRKGKIFLLMAEGRETKKYKEAVAKYKGVQSAISRGQIPLFPFPPRILPPDANPACDLVHLDIPEFINPANKGKRGKAQSTEKGLVTGSASRLHSAGYLDPEEDIRFRQHYLLPRRNIRKVTLESSLVRQRRKQRLYGQTPRIDADTTSIVGHSDTTMGYLEIMDRMSTRKDSSSSDRRETTLDSYSKRMLELLDLSPPPPDQPMFSSLKRSMLRKEGKTLGKAPRSKAGTRGKHNSEYDSDHDRDESNSRDLRYGSLDDSDLDLIHSGVSDLKNPKRRYQHGKDSYTSLSEDQNEDNADLPTRPAPRPKAKRAKKGDSAVITLDAMFQQGGGGAPSKNIEGNATSNTVQSATKELPSISDDDVDMEIMGGLGGAFNLDGSPVRTRRRIISEDETSVAGAPLSPTFDESVFDYDFPMDDDWGLQDGEWDGPTGVDRHGDLDSLKGGFDFGESRRRGVSTQNWYTSDRSDNDSDEPEDTGDRQDERVGDEPMLMVLPPVPPPGQWYRAAA